MIDQLSMSIDRQNDDPTVTVEIKQLDSAPPESQTSKTANKAAEDTATTTKQQLKNNEES